MNIYQFNCNEGPVVDPQQANAVLRHKSDVIVFEAPSSKSPSLIYNKYTSSNKPIEKVSEYERMLKKVSKTYPWVASDIHVYENIKKLWSEGHDVKLYNVDGPRELLQTKIGGIKEPEPKQMKRKPQRRGTHLSWWVYVYLREKVMAKHIEKILTQ